MITFDLKAHVEKESSGNFGTQESLSPNDPRQMESAYSKRVYEQYRSRADSWRTNIVADRNHYYGQSLKLKDVQAIKKRGTVPLFIDAISPAVKQAIALLTSKDPQFSATGSEDSDIRVAKLYAGAMAYLWRFNKGRMKLKKTIEDYYVASTGWLMWYYDSFADNNKGENCFASLDPLKVFVDPASQDFFYTDAAHILIRDVLTEEQLTLQSPMMDFTGCATNAEADLPTSGHVDEGGNYNQTRYATDVNRYEVIDRYSKVKVSMFTIFDKNATMEKLVDQEGFAEFMQSQAVVQMHLSGETQYFVDDQSIKSAFEVYQQFGGIYHLEYTQSSQVIPVAGHEADAEDPMMTVPGSTVIMEIVPMEEMVKMGVVTVIPSIVTRVKRVYTVGGVTKYIELIPISEYPMVPLVSEYNRDPYPVSPVRRVRPMQEYKNKLRNLIVAHAANSAGVKVFVQKGSKNKAELQKEFAKAGASIIEVEMELGQPVVASPIPLPNELYKNEQDITHDIERVLGIYALMDGNPADAPSTYKGTVALDEYAQRRIQSQRDDIEQFLNFFGSIGVQMMQAYWTEYKVIRLFKPNDQIDVIGINTDRAFRPEDLSMGQEWRINDISTGKYDIVTVSGSMLPSNRWALAEYYLELYKVGILDKEEFLKKSEVADVEGVLRRTGEIQQLQGMVNQLQEELKRVSGDLQTASREAVHAGKQIEVMKTKMQMNELTTRAKMATELYEARLIDEFAYAKLEKKLTAKTNSATKISKPTKKGKGE